MFIFTPCILIWVVHCRCILHFGRLPGFEDFLVFQGRIMKSTFQRQEDLIFCDGRLHLQEWRICHGKHKLRKRLQKPWWVSAQQNLQWCCWDAHRSKNQGTLHKPKETQNIHPIFVIQENLYSSHSLAAGFEERTKPKKFLGMYESKKLNYHRHPLCPPSLWKLHVI